MATEPHEQLSIQHIMVRSDGELEQYVCRTCRSEWERFNTSAVFGQMQRFWKRLR